MSNLHKPGAIREKRAHASLIACLLVCYVVDGSWASTANEQLPHHTAGPGILSKEAPRKSVANPDLLVADNSHATAAGQLGQDELQTASIARLTEVLTHIEQQYVDPVEAPQLVSGCKARMLQLAPRASVAEGSNIADGATSA